MVEISGAAPGVARESYGIRYRIGLDTWWIYVLNDVPFPDLRNRNH